MDPWAWGGKDPRQEKEHRNAPPLSRPLRSHDPSQARILPACLRHTRTSSDKGNYHPQFTDEEVKAQRS